MRCLKLPGERAPLMVCRQTIAVQRMARDFDRQVAELQIRAFASSLGPVAFTRSLHEPLHGTRKRPKLDAGDDFVQGKGKLDLRLIYATGPVIGLNQPSRKMQILMESYKPGADTGAIILHDAQAAGLVLEGRIGLTVGKQTCILEVGDGYCFDSNLPHRFRNGGLRSDQNNQRYHSAQLLNLLPGCGWRIQRDVQAEPARGRGWLC